MRKNVCYTTNILYERIIKGIVREGRGANLHKQVGAVQKVRFRAKIQFLTICKSIYYDFNFGQKLPFLDSPRSDSVVRNAPTA